MTDTPWLGPAIDLRPLYPKQQAAFVDLLRELNPEEWALATICPRWSVKDVATHVLGDNVGRLSIHRDGHQVMHPRDDEALPAFLDRVNEEWVAANRRLSPLLLIELLARTSEQIAELWNTLDIHAQGGSVYWAGPEPHPVWLDAARDFTEYWTHHQQICDATGRAGLTDPEYLGPVLDSFLRALPHTLRDADAAVDTTLKVTVTGPAGGVWICTRSPDRWILQPREALDPAAHLTLDADTTWRLCTRGITPEQAASRARIEGDQPLARAALNIVSIIWAG